MSIELYKMLIERQKEVVNFLTSYMSIYKEQLEQEKQYLQTLQDRMKDLNEQDRS